MNRKKNAGQQKRSTREQLFNMVSVGVIDEPLNQAYDIISTGLLLINLTASILMTFQSIQAVRAHELRMIESFTVFFFAIDYFLRLCTAKYLYPQKTEGKAMLCYVVSAAGVIDLLSFLPYYLPVFFPSGAAAFRMFRVARIFRLFRINAYYDSLNVITEVIQRKKQQLLSSVFIILVLMVASSLCMYSLEHEAQPEVFKNAFSGIWWAASTLLTVGYGDIYPVTQLGKAFGIAITFLGVGMVAIPTGIISAGFVEQYQRLKRIGEYAIEESIRFINVELQPDDSWCGKPIREAGLPARSIIAVVQRGRETLIPRGDVILQAYDRLVIGAPPIPDDQPIELKEVHLQKNHEWNGTAIRDLDISRRTYIIMVNRAGVSLVPAGDLILQEGDDVILFSKLRQSQQADED